MANSTLKPAFFASTPPEIDDERLYEEAIYELTSQPNYYATYWAPLLEGKAAQVIHAIYRETRFYKDAWRKDEQVRPKYITLALAAKCARSTVGRVFQRVLTIEDATELSATYGEDVQPGDFAYGYHGRWKGQLIERWVRVIENRWHYNGEQQTVRQASNKYTVTAIMPPIPDHDEKVMAKYYERKALKERAAQAIMDAATNTNRTQESDRLQDSIGEPIIGHQIMSSNSFTSLGIRRSPQEGEVNGVGPVAIGKTINKDEQGTAQPHQSNPTNQEQVRLATKSDRIAENQDDGANTEIEIGSHRKGTTHGAAAGRAPRSEAEMADKAHAEAVARDVLTENGDTLEKATALGAYLAGVLEQAGAPYESMVPLLRHLKKRLAHTTGIKDRAHYYMTIVQNEIGTAKRGQWNIDKLYAKERQKWVKEAAARGTPSAGKPAQARQGDRVSLADMVGISREVWG